jgi:hypothetical protein
MHLPGQSVKNVLSFYDRFFTLRKRNTVPFGAGQDEIGISAEAKKFPLEADLSTRPQKRTRSRRQKERQLSRSNLYDYFLQSILKTEP